MCGFVVYISPGAEALAVGDFVFGMADTGSLAEYVATDVKLCMKLNKCYSGIPSCQSLTRSGPSSVQVLWLCNGGWFDRALGIQEVEQRPWQRGGQDVSGLNHISALTFSDFRLSELLVVWDLSQFNTR